MDFGKAWEEHMVAWVKPLHPLQALALCFFKDAVEEDPGALRRLLDAFGSLEFPLCPPFLECAPARSPASLWAFRHFLANLLAPYLARHYIPPGDPARGAHFADGFRLCFSDAAPEEIRELMHSRFAAINPACGDWLKGEFGTNEKREWVKRLHPVEALALCAWPIVAPFLVEDDPGDPFDAARFLEQYSGRYDARAVTWLCSAILEDNVHPPDLPRDARDTLLREEMALPFTKETRKAFWERWARLARHAGDYVRRWYNPNANAPARHYDAWYIEKVFNDPSDPVFRSYMRESFAAINSACRKWLESPSVQR